MSSVRFVPAGLVVALSWASSAHAQKVYLNPSDQVNNAVSGGGVESQYALIVANLVKPILDGAGFTARVDQDFSNAPPNANSWGADIFVSIHTNAGGGHGTETLYTSAGGQALAGDVQDGLLAQLPYASRGLKPRNDLWVLNGTNMAACLTESLFHDCSTTSGQAGHPPSESGYLRSGAGQQAIATGIAQGICAHYGRSCTSTPTTKGFLKGAVYQRGDLQDHVAGATVTLNTGPSVAYDGTTVWSFELDPGTYTLTASAPGYTPNSLQRTVTAGATTWGSIELTAVPTADAGVPLPPPVPSPVSPVGGATVDGAAVVLTWSTVADPQGGVVTYDVELYRGAATGTPLVALGVPTAASTTISSALQAGSHAWRVRARNAVGASAWSTAATFEVASPSTSSSSSPPTSGGTSTGGGGGGGGGGDDGDPPRSPFWRACGCTTASASGEAGAGGAIALGVLVVGVQRRRRRQAAHR